MLLAPQAEALILEQVRPLDAERESEVVDLLNATGRVLAKAIASSLDFPHWDNSAMDGYAVRAVDVQACSAEQPAVLDIIEEIPAGCQPQKSVQSGQAARILTGSMMPAGADTVVIQEVTQRQGDRILILEPPQPRQFVRHRAEFYRAGEPLLPPGTLLNAPEIAVLAAAQCPQVPVYRRPKVAILSTGSELVAPDQPLQPGQIVDSNQYALAALVQQSGAEVMRLGIVPDQPEVLRQAIAHAISVADVVLSSGGVSVGDYDYVDQILAELQAQIHIRSVAIRPGKPLTFATLEAGKLYFGLPGNPVSALVTFWRFVQPALRKLSGWQGVYSPNWVRGRSHAPLKSDGKRETYVWGQVQRVDGEYEFRLAEGSRSSGNLINLARTNALALIPLGTTQIAPGDSIQLLLMDGPRLF